MICIYSDCHLSNGCIEPHLVASDGLVSAKLDQCINNAGYTRFLKATDQIMEEGDIAILPIGINHKAANLAIL